MSELEVKRFGGDRENEVLQAITDGGLLVPEIMDRPLRRSMEEMMKGFDERPQSFINTGMDFLCLDESLPSFFLLSKGSLPQNPNQTKEREKELQFCTVFVARK